MKTVGSDPSLDFLHNIFDVFGDDKFMGIDITVDELPNR